MLNKANVVPLKKEALRPTYRGPFAMFDELKTEFESLMQKPFWPTFLTHNRFHEEKTTWMPRIDAFEKEGELVVRADLPGMKKEEVHVTLEENDLILFGERKEEKEIKEESFYRAECNYGSFYRRLPLAFKVSPDKILAKFTDGVLEVHVPMPPEARDKALPIPVQ
jgi:HSP20 family protein